jgi:hypothetical protein
MTFSIPLRVPGVRGGCSWIFNFRPLSRAKGKPETAVYLAGRNDSPRGRGTVAFDTLPSLWSKVWTLQKSVVESVDCCGNYFGRRGEGKALYRREDLWVHPMGTLAFALDHQRTP